MGAAIMGAIARSPLNFNRCTAVRATSAYMNAEVEESKEYALGATVMGDGCSIAPMQTSQRYVPPTPQPTQWAGSTVCMTFRRTAGSNVIAHPHVIPWRG